jgi:hypothetical protein
MAKYVLLAFEEDNDADRFVLNFGRNAIFQAIDVIDDVHHGYEYVGVRAKSRVRGVYKCPTLFHNSADCKGDSFARGPKWGWMVCTKCGKPTKGWAEGDGWFTALGTNLLPVTEEAPEYRGFGVSGHYWDASKKAYIPYVSDAKPIASGLGGKAGLTYEEAIERGIVKKEQANPL